MWDSVKRYWLENDSKVTNTNNEDLGENIEGSFRINDTFIKSTYFEIPLGTTVFITFDAFDDLYDMDMTFEWELWDDYRNKLLMKSKHNYIVWNCVNDGIYSVKLNIYQFDQIITTINKTSWFKVT